MNKYQEWIFNYKGGISRRCVEVTTEMQKVFPELRIAKGMVTIVENCKDYPHQWLVDENENIVDPTANQWLGIIEYKEIKDDDPQPRGKCLNCGGWVYTNSKHSDFCNDKCVQEYLIDAVS